MCVFRRCFADVVRAGEVDGVLQVLGVSSPQLDDQHRGLTDRSILPSMRGFAVRRISTQSRRIASFANPGVQTEFLSSTSV